MTVEKAEKVNGIQARYPECQQDVTLKSQEAGDSTSSTLLHSSPQSAEASKSDLLVRLLSRSRSFSLLLTRFRGKYLSI